MQNIIFLSTSEVVEIHDLMIAEYGGLPGTRDNNLLESAVGAPKQCFDGYFLNKDIFEMAATYFRSLATNHAFNEGNKRTAAFCAFVFLHKNGYLLELEEDELVEYAIKVTTQKPSREEIAAFLRGNASVMQVRKG